MTEESGTQPRDCCQKAKGCEGIALSSGSGCLRHTRGPERQEALANLKTGDLSITEGVQFDHVLFGQVMAVLPRDGKGKPILRNARFNGASFESLADFREAIFDGPATFDGCSADSVDFTNAAFLGPAWFRGVSCRGVARFNNVDIRGEAGFQESIFGEAEFVGARFQLDAFFDKAAFREADFTRARFAGVARFPDAKFTGPAEFRLAQFHRAHFSAAEIAGPAIFDHATFSTTASFDAIKFKAGTSFREARFSANVDFGSGWFGCHLQFDNATFAREVDLDLAVARGDMHFVGSTFEEARMLGFFLCEGKISVDRAVFKQPSTIIAASRRLTAIGTEFRRGVTLQLRYADVVLGSYLDAKSLLTSWPNSHPLETGLGFEQRADGVPPRLLTLLRSDATNLVVGHVDLSAARFTGAHNLDALRLDRAAIFAKAPRWRTRRSVLAEEFRWRARTTSDSSRWHEVPSACHWPEDVLPDAPDPDPSQIATIYRSLRKALEDRSDEPGAADFYYGEMEMRRHSKEASRGERFVVGMYWAVSGYGLRALRSLAWLALAIALFAGLFFRFGFESPSWLAALLGDTTPSITESFLYSAGTATTVFGGPEQELTHAGQWLRIALRILGPTLIALSVLAIRARIKR